jgi:hypothetical protein
VYGEIPPVVVDVKITGELTTGLEGRNVKLVDGGGGGLTITVVETVTVFEGVEESVAFSVTVKD